MKTILIVDDQQLVLLSLEKCLNDFGYRVVTSNNVFDAISKYDQHNPDLVIVDINMPVLPTSDSSTLPLGVNEKASGLEIIKYIKTIKQHETPVMILSGNTDEDVIEKGFSLGAQDYMKKPLSLNEIGLRVKRLIGASNIRYNADKNRYIQNKVVGIVIPCYNEASRLSSDEFKTFVTKNLGYHLCFVNDGSKDNTLELLYDLKKNYEGRISVYDCPKNGGKAEAVRLGMLHLAKEYQFDYIGFLDADLSTNLDDFNELVETIYNSDFKVVSGSRIPRMGAEITKESSRAIISKTVNYIIRKTLGMNFKDTQCGAKIMTKEIIEKTFQKKFLTKWLFDVEIFMRMKKVYGKENAEKFICEKPLNRWIHMDGSKLSFKDSFKIIGQIGQIAFYYR
ncbi:response regulator [Flavobacterium sp. SUN052]|uniref:response regulator n=1 Tax=Flavobacterium sp. SUN052 TaxID=3002441 RepID=UPI00237DB11E|nr:response regulator [Flavobacterium sp. SUN052]MEC4003986.1 response regulator [Flavobacterium sp. SUN052]